MYWDITMLTAAVARIDAVQAEYSAFETLHETDELISTAKELGIAYVAYSPLGHGWLVDNFDIKSPDDFPAKDLRRTSRWTYLSHTRPFCRIVLTYIIAVPKFQGENFYQNKAIVEELKKVAARRGCTTAQIALAWVAAQGMIAIPGTTKVDRLEENWASWGIELTEEELVELRRIVENAKPVGNRYSAALQAIVGH